MEILKTISGRLGSAYPIRCTIDAMKIPASLQTAMAEIARKFGSQGGKKAAQNMTAEERSVRAKKAARAAAEKRTAKRLAREGIKRERKASKRS